MKFFILILALNAHAHDILTKPNLSLTPGAFCSIGSPDFKELRYSEQIPVCNRNVTNTVKNKVYDSYKIPVSDRSNYTVDHMIPLFIGGSNDITNLWPQHKSISSAMLELRIYHLIDSAKLGSADCLNLIYAIKK